MKIVLIALYNLHSYAIRGFHSLLLKHGYDVESMYFMNSTYTDRAPTRKEIDTFVHILKDKKPDVVAISVHSPLFQIFKQMSVAIREHIPHAKIAVGGEHPTAQPEDCLPYADYVVIGEGERAILELADGKMPEGINGPYNLWKDLDSLPHGYYGSGTWGFSRTNKLPPVTSYMTGRGCPYACTYCQESVRNEVHGSTYNHQRRKSVSKVMEDLEYFKVSQGMSSVFFSDSVFTTNKQWLMEFCEEFPRLGMRFGCYGHTVGLTEESIKALKGAGLGSFRLGVQSGSGYIRSRVFNRKDTLEGILNTASLLGGNGVSVIYDFIVNNPYDTPETLRDTRNFIGKLPPGSGINNFELRWFPGLPLTKTALADGLIEAKDVEGQYTRLGNWDYCYAKGA